MMYHAEKERLAMSAVIALIVYVVFFLITGWMDILKPGPPRQYYGTVNVELAFEPVTSVRETLPAEPPRTQQPQPAPVEPQRAQPQPQPTVQSRPQPTPAVTAQPQPAPAPRVTVPSRDTAPAAVTQSQPQGPAAPRTVDQAQPDLPDWVIAQERAREVGAAQPAQSTAPGPVSATSQPLTPDRPATSPARSQQFAAGETADRPLPTTPTGTLPAARQEASTGTAEQFGRSAVEFAASQPTSSGTPAPAAAAASSGPAQTVLGDAIAAADRALAEPPAASRGAAAAGTSTGSGAQSAVELIVAQDVEELSRRRSFRNFVEPRIGFLSESQRWVDVELRFSVDGGGNVAPGITFVRGSGITAVDAAIERAIRQWKFTAVSSEKPVTVELRYRVLATTRE